MVGFMIVSHGENLARSVAELTSIMAPNARTTPAGDMDGGGFRAGPEKIQAAIESIYSDDGVLILVDLGSAVMTTEMVVEILKRRKVEMVDRPLVEGAVIATIDSVGGTNSEDIRATLAGVGRAKRFQDIVQGIEGRNK